MPPMTTPPGLAGARYVCRSLPHMPEALISRITSRGPGVGSGNRLSSSLRSPRNTTPFMVLLRCAVFGVPASLGRVLINAGFGRMSAVGANRTRLDGGTDVNDPKRTSTRYQDLTASKADAPPPSGLYTNRPGTAVAGWYAQSGLAEGANLMAPSDYLQRFWLCFAIFGTVVILLAAGIYVVETLPPRRIVMATGPPRRCLPRTGYSLPSAPDGGRHRAAAAANNRSHRESDAAAGPSVRGGCWIHPGRDYHSEGIARGGVAGHVILRAAVVLHPYQWQSYRRDERPTIFDWSRGKRDARPGAPTV